ncbi:MAG TPA: hypothetical protein V6D00_11515 [Pantanalinema sp.]
MRNDQPDPPKIADPDIIKTITSLLPSCITVLGILVGVWQFNTANRIADATEFKRRFWQEKLEVYRHADTIVGEIAEASSNGLKKSTIRKKAKEFDTLYFGLIPFIQTREDQKVREAGEALHRELKHYLLFSGSSTERIETLAINFVKATHESLMTTWKEVKD